MQKVNKTEEEWQAILSAEEYAVMRKKGTEAPFTGKYYSQTAPGMYHCNACKAKLFQADTKYDSGSGWPSFTSPVTEQAVTEISDHSHGMVRTEVVCASCGAHLGHVFPDGPAPSGLRYCINSISLDFNQQDD